MDIRGVYARIQAQVENESFFLSEETTGVLKLGQLCRAFGLECIRMQKFVCVLREEELELQGDFTVSPIYQNLHMELLLTGEGRIHAAFIVPEILLDSARLFCVRNTLFSFEWIEGENSFSENIEGKLEFGGIAFEVTSNRSDLCARRQFVVKSAQELDAMAFVNAALSLLGMDLSMFGLEMTSLFTIKEYVFKYTAGSDLLMADEAEQLEIVEGNFDEIENEDFSDDYFECSIKTDIGFEFQNKFGMEDIGFRFGRN